MLSRCYICAAGCCYAVKLINASTTSLRFNIFYIGPTSSLVFSDCSLSWNMHQNWQRFLCRLWSNLTRIYCWTDCHNCYSNFIPYVNLYNFKLFCGLMLLIIILHNDSNGVKIIKADYLYLLNLKHVWAINVEKNNNISLSFNPLSPHDALKHHFTSLKLYLISRQLRVLERKFPWNWFTNTWQFFLIFGRGP